jgi:hypothetical protein
LADISVDESHLGLPCKQRSRQIAAEAALADSRATDDKDRAPAPLENLASRSLPLWRNMELGM